MNKYNVNVLTDAKEEYTRQLINILYPEIYIGIKSIYDAAYKHCSRTHTSNQILKKFQTFLSEIPKWNQDKIDAEYKRISIKSECDWIDDLITAVFVSHTKVLSSLKLKNCNKTIPLNVPVGTYFIHKCYIETARNFWKKSWLMHIDVNPIDIQRNLVDSENLIKESIIETIRKLLPVKYILQEYLGEDYQDDDIDENLESHMLPSTKNNLRKLVKQEIEQTLSKKSIDTSDNFSMLEINNSPEDEIYEKNKTKYLKKNEELQESIDIIADMLEEQNSINKETLIQESKSSDTSDNTISDNKNSVTSTKKQGNDSKSNCNSQDKTIEKTDEKLLDSKKQDIAQDGAEEIDFKKNSDKDIDRKQDSEKDIDRKQDSDKDIDRKQDSAKDIDRKQDSDKDIDRKQDSDKDIDRKQDSDKDIDRKQDSDKDIDRSQGSAKDIDRKQDSDKDIDRRKDSDKDIDRSQGSSKDIDRKQDSDKDIDRSQGSAKDNASKDDDKKQANSDLPVKELEDNVTSDNKLTGGNIEDYNSKENSKEKKIIEINKDNDKQLDIEKVVKVEKIHNSDKVKSEPIKLKIEKDDDITENKDDLQIYKDINDSNEYEPYKLDNPDVHSQGNFSFFDDAIDYS